MATCVPGRKARLMFSFDGGSTWHKMGSVKSITHNGNVDERDCTTFDSDGHREFDPDHDDHTWDLEALYREGDVAQDGVLDRFFAKTKYLIEFTMETAIGKRKWTGEAFATTHNEEAPLDDNGNISVTFRGSGITIGVQT